MSEKITFVREIDSFYNSFVVDEYNYLKDRFLSVRILGIGLIIISSICLIFCHSFLQALIFSLFNLGFVSLIADAYADYKDFVFKVKWGIIDYDC